MKEFANRKEQIERDFLPNLIRQLKAKGVTVDKGVRALIKEELKSAAMVGACEERGRTLRLLRPSTDHTRRIESEIVSQGVLEVLGYED